MGRPPLGPSKKSRRIPLNVTEAQYALIQAKGGTEWVRRTVVAALTPTRVTEPVQKTPTRAKTKPPTPQPAPDKPAHRHKREKVKEKWVDGRDVGEYRCADPECRVILGPFQ